MGMRGIPFRRKQTPPPPAEWSWRKINTHGYRQNSSQEPIFSSGDRTPRQLHALADFVYKMSSALNCSNDNYTRTVYNLSIKKWVFWDGGGFQTVDVFNRIIRKLPDFSGGFQTVAVFDQWMFSDTIKISLFNEKCCFYFDTYTQKWSKWAKTKTI